MRTCPLCHQKFSDDTKQCNCGYDFITAEATLKKELSNYRPKFFLYGTLFNGTFALITYLIVKYPFIAIFKPFMDKHHIGLKMSMYGSGALVPPPPGFGLIIKYFGILTIYAIFIYTVNSKILMGIHKDKKRKYIYFQFGIFILLLCLSVLADLYIL